VTVPATADKITAFGRTLTIPEWSQRTGLGVRTIEQRIAHDWPVEQILTAPKSTRMATVNGKERLVNLVTPWEEDDRCWYVVAHHPGGLTLRQIGDIVGLTRERVRQIEAMALHKLRRHPRRAAALMQLMRESQEDEATRDDERSRTPWQRTEHALTRLPQREEKPMPGMSGREITAGGYVGTTQEHAERLGITRSAIEHRLAAGWTEEEACTHARGERPPRLSNGSGTPAADASSPAKKKTRRRGKKKTKKRKASPRGAAAPEPSIASQLGLVPPEPPDGRSRIEHRFPLSADCVVKVELPADFTEEEAERMSRWLSAIAF